MKIKIKFQQDDYKATYKVKLSETEKEKYKKNPISYCFNKMTSFLSTEYSFDWNNVTNIEKAVYKQTLGKPLASISLPESSVPNIIITIEHKGESQVIFAAEFNKDMALYWVNYVREFLKTYSVVYDR